MFLKGVFVVLCCISNVFGERKPCDLDDVQCLTDGAKRKFKEFITGIPSVETSDPLIVDLIEGNLPTLNYKLINGSLVGMLNCNVDLAQFILKEMKYNYHILCPHLILESEYEINGTLGPNFIDGAGTCKLDIYDYHILLSGDYGKYFSTDGKLHIQLNNQKLEYENKSKVDYDCKSKSDFMHNKTANENWQYVHKLTRQPALEGFMKKFIENVNAFLKVKAIEYFLYKED